MRKILFIFLIIIVVIILAAIFLYSFFYNKNSNTKYSCEDLAKIISESKKIDDIRSCNMKQYKLDEEKLYLISIDYGEGEDCESGCIYQEYTGLIDQKGNVTDFSWLPPYEKINELEKKYGRLCEVAPWTNTNPDSARKIEIIKIDGIYAWKQTYSNYKMIRSPLSVLYYGETGCILDGVITSSQHNTDSSRFTVKPILIDCNKISDVTKSEYCWSDWAAIKNDLKICENYANNNYCYYGVAIANFNNEACAHILPSNIAGYDPKKYCLESIKIENIGK